MAKSNSNESFIRWQDRLLQQRGSVNNLLLGLAVATTGFQISIVFDESFCFYGLDKFYFEFSTPLILLSIIFGIGTEYTRLIDFRLTAKLARLRSTNSEKKSLKVIRKRASAYGKWTEWLFALQTSSLCIGFMFLLAYYVVRYYHVFYNR